jgi:hypothetical protein
MYVGWYGLTSSTRSGSFAGTLTARGSFLYFWLKFIEYEGKNAIVKNYKRAAAGSGLAGTRGAN